MSGLASRPTAATSAAKIARSALSCAFVALGLSGCDDGDSPLSSGTELLVVTGYLFAGEPVGEVDVSVTVPLDSESEVAPAVNDARLVLTVNETSYELELALGDSGRYAYPAGDLTVMPGDALSLRVERGDMVVRAATVVPPAPVNLTVSAERLVVEPDTAFAGFGGFGRFARQGEDAGETLTVSWEAEEDARYFVTIENVEADPDSVESLFARPPGSFASPLMRGNSLAIQSLFIGFYGTHEVRVFRVTEEYAALEAFRFQNLDELAEPPTNIENGLGIFTAFSSAVVEFEVVRPD